ncbi:MAG: sigma-70 family RNA polymerase sigma factor [Acidobacteriota bacterium]|nr:sigma-70 family RNA polymerase sigma factor [Acidobacteriota bacterium]
MQKQAADHAGLAFGEFAHGDPAAFEGIIREHQAMVFSLALHFLREPSQAEDVAQEVFLELYQNRAAIESASHLRFWLRKVTCHRSLDSIRRRASHCTTSLADAPEPVAAENKHDPILQRRLGRLINTLPEKWRMALILRYQEDLEYREIAEVMGIPVNSVKSSLERALALMHEKLARSTAGVRK